MSLGDRIKEARLAAGMTQQQVSDSLGIAKSSISSYENGNREPPPLMISQLMNLFGVNANFLFQDFQTEEKTRELTEKEKDLLFCYNRISPHNQERLLQVAHYLIDSEEMETFLEKVRTSQTEEKEA